MNWRDRITSDPKVCGGVACIRGTRIMVSVAVDCIAAGMTVQQIVDEYPPLTAADIQAAVEYAADLTRDRVVFLGPAA